VPALSRGWGKVQGLVVLACAAFALGVFSLSLSPLFWQHAAEAIGGWQPGLLAPMLWLVRGVIYTSIALLVLVPLLCASGPAAVSTACAGLVHGLNDMRMADLTERTHGRLVVLEAALNKLNKDQGMGFLLGMKVRRSLSMLFSCRPLFLVRRAVPSVLVQRGVARSTLTPFRPLPMGAIVKVVNTELLSNVGRGLFMAGSLLMPFILQLKVQQMGGAPCALTSVQGATIRAAMIGHPAACRYNLTLADILAGGEA
jgi:hypothetical protein